jgi:hypothetical protein
MAEDFIPREGDALDVGFGGDIDVLTEKLMLAKKVMEVSDRKNPFTVKGQDRSGSLINPEKESPKIESFTESLSKKTASLPAPKQQKRVISEDENYITYAKNGSDEEEDEYDVRNAPSLTQELMMATKSQGQTKSLPDMIAKLNENIIRKSKLPDVIKESFLKNPLTPPSLTSALGSDKLNAITDKFKQINNKEQQSGKKVVSEVKTKPTTIINEKREKIKEQLRPIVKELIREILSENLLK